jgi:hypothetical protein
MSRARGSPPSYRRRRVVIITIVIHVVILGLAIKFSYLVAVIHEEKKENRRATRNGGEEQRCPGNLLLDNTKLCLQYISPAFGWLPQIALPSPSLVIDALSAIARDDRQELRRSDITRVPD